MPPVRRLASALSVATVLLALGAAPAMAKVPYFSVELAPLNPLAGEPVSVTVRLWNDSDHTFPADWAPPDRAMDEMLVFQASEQEVPVDLTRADDGSYRATVTLPAGSWILVPFPDVGGLGQSRPGYAGPIALTVAAPLSLQPIAVGLAAVAILTAVVGRRGMLRRKAIRLAPEPSAR